jgi:hypothetical protein
VKDKKTGKTDWDNIQELASQGWELVSVTPITVWQGEQLAFFIPSRDL